MSAVANTELSVNINNMKAMSYLSIYYAYKIRAATYLKAGAAQNANKIAALGTAYCWWMNYSNLMDAMYNGMTMQRVDDLPNWHSVDAAVLAEYTRHGGVGTPNCSSPVIETARNQQNVEYAIKSLSSTTVSFSLPNPGAYSLSIFTAAGAKIMSINSTLGKNWPQ